MTLWVSGRHFNEGPAFRFIYVVDDPDIGMVEGGCSLGFPAEALQGLRILRDFVGEEFQGDMAVKIGVFGFVDNSHASAADLLDEAKMRDGLSDLGYHFLLMEVSCMLLCNDL